jgi:hypothetical protein
VYIENFDLMRELGWIDKRKGASIQRLRNETDAVGKRVRAKVDPFRSAEPGDYPAVERAKYLQVIRDEMREASALVRKASEIF